MKKEIIYNLSINNKSGVKTRETYIKKHYLDDYLNIIKIDFTNNWNEKLYCYVNDINSIPKCICLNCNNNVHFKKYSEGYYKYCSILCRNSDDSLKLFGNKNPMKKRFNIEKAKKTKKEKYGDENYNNRNKFKETTYYLYGISGYTNREKAKKTSLNRYGNEYYNNREKQYITMIERYGEIWINYTPKYNINSIVYIDMISEKLNLPIQHALNGGEKKFIKYWIDGYIEKYNICIEWDEKHHNGTRQKERDVKKELFLIEKFGCKIIRINEKEFLKNIETSINNLSGLILGLINNK